MTNFQKNERTSEQEKSSKKGKCVSTLESWYRLIIVVAALGTFLFYLVLLPPPTLSIFPGIKENLSQLAVLFLWVVWGVYLSFFLIMIGFMFASPTLIQRKHQLQTVKEGELFQRTESLSKLLGLKKQPEILLEKSDKALCMVFGTFPRPNKLLVSTGLLENLESTELDAVLLHELSHVKNRDVGIATWGDYLKNAIKYAIVIIISLRIAVVATDAAYGFSPDIAGAFVDLPLMITVTLIIPVFVINSGLRKREMLADARAFLYLKESTALKSAMVKTVLANFKALSSMPTLEKEKQNNRLRKPNMLSKISGKFSQTRSARFFTVHPTIKERIADMNEEKHLFSPEKFKLPRNETMLLSGIASVYILPVGLFLVALPAYLTLYWSNATPGLLIGIGLVGVILYFVAPSIVIFLPIYESIRLLSGNTLRGLSGKNLLKYVFSLGKKVTAASSASFIFGLLAFSNGEFSVESVATWLIYAFVYTAVALILSLVYLMCSRRKRAN